MKKNLFLLAITCAINLICIAQAKIFNDSIPSGKNFDKACFRLWCPDKYKNIKGIIVLVPGSNGDGRSLVEEIFWQQLAQKHQFGLLGCYFTDKPHDDMNVEAYANAKQGSGQALEDAVKKLAIQSGITLLPTVPLVLWGHSAGGQFNYEFVCWRPQRVLAFVVNKGGFYYTALAPKAAREVPGIIFIGENDFEPRNDILKGIFSINRRAGAFWTLAIEPNAGHEIGQTQNLAGIFFDQIIPIRTQTNTHKLKKSSMLLPLSMDSCYAGSLKSQSFSTMTIGQRAEYSVCFLPDLRFAMAWESFIKKNPF